MMELRMDAYWYSFKKTGIPEIDLILSAVACAGKSFHNTAYWNDEAGKYEGHEGDNPVDWIQNAADKAARAWNTRVTPPASQSALKTES